MALLFVGSAAVAIDSLVKDRTVLRPIAAEQRASATGELGALGNATEWINSPPLTEAGLRGKVVLVEFWTYTCINWLRVQPYVRAWAERYRDQGLVVIGVHAPEFGFEKDLANVRRAAQDLRVDYPIAVDNDHAIWRAFDNNYWPALYFVDDKGRVRHHQYGEGGYQESERVIQELLAEAGRPVANNAPTSVEGRGVEAAADWGNLRSTENYLGLARTENFASPGGGRVDQTQAFGFPGDLGLNQWALSGEWKMGRESVALAKADGRIGVRFHARDLHLVMGPTTPGTPIRFRVLIDGQPPGDAHGLDVDARGYGTLDQQRMYQLIRQTGTIRDRQFEIEFLDPGALAFAFTFG